MICSKYITKILQILEVNENTQVSLFKEFDKL